MNTFINHIETILYVQDQEQSTLFYEKLLRQKPSLHVPGMTEFTLNDSCKLGLMPNSGISKIISPILPQPATGTGIPRCELYLKVNDVHTVFEHALNCGAQLISPVQARNWGDTVCYFADADGHVIAFAQQT
jgi:predicted enzyme related to lactoylglutathione lyase